jgi:hypothetical protein
LTHDKAKFDTNGICIISISSIAQKDGQGVFAAIGLGVGYSTFGEHYYETREGTTGINITEFSGFRSVVLNARIGYQVSDRIGISAKYTLIPANSTVLPISSNWLGGNITYSFSESYNYYVILGAGTANYKAPQQVDLGKNVLYNVGFGLKMGKAIIEFECYTGSVNSINSLEPNPFVDINFEIMPVLSFSYLFAKG